MANPENSEVQGDLANERDCVAGELMRTRGNRM
jgi:hypothetical protein